ncbi:MBL fold metallo-hydrolase RNA specificity domain-containing protein [Psychromonas sp. SR45-3]|uniref:MBL fold metallo-hydrolase RNA specificity domain-containing protein n=1 Tax=Psychromonas sp. SR45-3 TaxID=2760930 RepID=UPI0015F79D15|nr:MBL fold metallo-hydrolase [Psychromonas sp. SR45-3]MBB1274719.1 MBL fold metallo-hydrolase [Psychromonas sp. SR45-3]
MQILHHGAVNGVTGSCHQLIVDDHHSLLVDCGLFQGAETSGRSDDDLLSIEFDISTVQALLVTHCHIDHVGRIPYLLAAGFTGPIIATEATAALLPMVIEDALKVGVTRNQSIIKACLARLKDQLIAVPYKQWHSISLLAASDEGRTDNFNSTKVKAVALKPAVIKAVALKVKFQPAGHILGSAYIEVDVKSSDSSSPKLPSKEKSNKSTRIIFSGDLGATYSPLLAAPKSPYRADIVVIESTYGDKNHQGRRDRAKGLEKILIKAIADNGVVLIPAFSIGRTQELLYELEQIISHTKFKNLADIEVIVDSPMAAKFTEYYQQFQTLWDAEAKNRVKQGRHPLNFDSLYTVDSHKEHMQVVEYLAKRSKPAIVIAASGMCSGGRIVNYLKRFISEPTADILFVGYQAQGTLGRQIQQYGPSGGYVFIDGEKLTINAGVHTISGYSAHAGQDNLVNFIKRIRHQPKKVIVVHGDDQAKQALVDKLSKIGVNGVIGNNKGEEV